MLLSSTFMIILYLILKYVLAWIRYFNSLDSRLGQSTWRWSYDYPVVGERDISDLDDKIFVRLRRKRNRVIHEKRPFADHFKWGCVDLLDARNPRTNHHPTHPPYSRVFVQLWGDRHPTRRL